MFIRELYAHSIAPLMDALRGLAVRFRVVQPGFLAPALLKSPENSRSFLLVFLARTVSFLPPTPSFQRRCSYLFGDPPDSF